MYFAYYTCTTKLRISSWSCGSVLRVLRLYYKVTIFQLELRQCTSRTTLVLQSCDFPAGVAEVYFAYCTYKVAIFQLELRQCTSRTTLVLKSCDFELGLRKCISFFTVVLQSCDFRTGAAEVYFAFYTCTTKLRCSGWSCGNVLCVLHVYYKVAILQRELSRTTLVLKSCDFELSCGSVLRVLHLYYKVAILQRELRKCTSRTTLVLKSCDFELSCGSVFRYYACTTKLRFSSWGCGSVLRVLHVYHKVAIFQLELRKCTLRNTLVLKSLDSRV